MGGTAISSHGGYGPMDDIQNRSEGGVQAKDLKAVVISYLMPWIVSLGLFSLVRQIVLAVNTTSIVDGLLFAVLPFTAWYFIAQAHKSAITSPNFVPRFLLSILTISYATFLIRLSADTPLILSSFLTVSSAALAFFFVKVSNADPGFIPKGSPPEGGYQTAPPDETAPLVSTSNASQWPQKELLPLEDIENPAQEGGQLETVASTLATGAAAALEGGQESTPLVDTQPQPQYHHSYFCYECHIWRWPRSKHCRKCNRCTDRFDHHCPAIANCVGRRNHTLFVAMLLAFMAAEYTFVQCALHYLQAKGHLELPADAQKALQSSDPLIGDPITSIQHFFFLLTQALCAEPWLVTVSSFLSFQLVWETPLFLFHCYCACVNITTNEFATWRKNPLLYVETPPGPGRPFPGKKFVNPHDKGVIKNVKSFFLGREP